jgi:hypothetical protein
MSERSASVPAPPRRTLKAPAAALARVQKVLPVEPVAPVRSRPQQAYDIVTEAAVPSDQAENSPLDPEAVARRKERNERRNALALTLRQRWPDLFTRPSVTPWAIGMHHQIVEMLGCAEKDLRAVLAFWSSSPSYQKALAAGVMRRNLDGSEAGEPTLEERAWAAGRLAQMKAAQRERDGARNTDPPVTGD